MNQTVFQVYAKQHAGSGQFWKILIVVSVILIVGVYTLTDGKYIALGPSPLLIAIIYFATRNKKKDIKIFVNQQKSDFEFGYYDAENKMHGPFPIQEYTYWAHERSATHGGWNIDLYFQINTNNVTIYLKNSIVSKGVPAGWARSSQSLADNLGSVFLTPDLEHLAKIIDGASVEETATA